ncbi:MAG TPA: HAD family phosphatase [Thermoanaerobaculia bacterium]
MISWFLFDLGNTVIRLAYERVIESICRDSKVDRDELLEIFEMPGGYRDMERGAATFWEFHEFLSNRAGYRGTVRDLHTVWENFFDGPMPGIEEVLDRVRKKYRVAFLSNSNEVHAEVIPKQFAALFNKDDRFIFSHRFKVAKPEPELFQKALEVIGAQPQDAVFIDDLLENVLAARSVGIRSFQYADSESLVKQLEGEGLL